MKIISLILLMILVAGENIVLAGNNKDAKAIVDSESNIVTKEGYLLIPVNLDNLDGLIAARLVFQYEGELGEVAFEPTELLQAPLMTPLLIDRTEKTIDISVATTKRVGTSDKLGNLGYLKLDSRTELTSIKLVKVHFVDGNLKKDEFVNETGSSVNPSRIAEAATSKTTIKRTRLFQNYPNPANPTTTIAFDLKEKSYVRLDIYNVGGSLIRTLASSTYVPNRYELKWDGLDQGGGSVSSGIYFYRFQAGSHIETKKLIILK